MIGKQGPFKIKQFTMHCEVYVCVCARGCVGLETIQKEVLAMFTTSEKEVILQKKGNWI
jgi:hypothetical protein